jgi:hypoxanthine phosphoribosyltransferase
MPSMTYLSFNTIVESCKKLSRKIKRSKIEYDCIVSIGRGGMVISRLLSELLDIRDVYIYDISGYGIHGNKKCLGINEDYIKDRSILLVDDVIQTGGTLSKVIVDLFNESLNADIAVYAVDKKYYKKFDKKSSIYNIYFTEKYDGDNDWIVFPWESL